MIICGVELSHDHREAFDKLDDDGKNDFLWRFRHAINVPEADFVTSDFIADVAWDT